MKWGFSKCLASLMPLCHSLFYKYSRFHLVLGPKSHSLTCWNSVGFTFQSDLISFSSYCITWTNRVHQPSTSESPPPSHVYLSICFVSMSRWINCLQSTVSWLYSYHFLGSSSTNQLSNFIIIINQLLMFIRDVFLHSLDLQGKLTYGHLKGGCQHNKYLKNISQLRAHFIFHTC
jgi:hypothetical protein